MLIVITAASAAPKRSSGFCSFEDGRGRRAGREVAGCNLRDLFSPNDTRCGFRKLKEQGVGNPHSGAAVVPKSLLVLL